MRRAHARARSTARIVVTGIGPTAATRAAAAVATVRDARHVLVAGLCGVLAPTLRVGETLVYGELLGPNERAIELDRAFARALAAALPGSQSGIRSIESSTIVTRASEKRALAAAHGAQAVDMESFAIADALGPSGAAVGVLRIASDDADADLPALDRTLNGSGGIDGFAFALALVRHPIAGARLIRDGMRALAALERCVYAVCVAPSPPAGRS